MNIDLSLATPHNERKPKSLARQAKLGASFRVKVPVG
jgi:hypothetical protein